MENKLLTIGSITAVVVLVLAGLSPVVGFDSVRSSKMDSPLFNVRTSRAINEESKDLTCDYFGKGKACTLYIPRRNSQMETALKVIDSIAKMDDKSFNNIIARVVRHLQRQGEFTETDTSEVIQVFHYLKSNPDEMKYIFPQYGLGDETTGFLATCYIILCLYQILALYFIYFLMTLYNIANELSFFGVYYTDCRCN